MQLEDQDKILIRKAIMALETQLKKQSEDLHFEEEVLAHMTGAARTDKVHADVEKADRELKRLEKLRGLFSAQDIDITISRG